LDNDFFLDPGNVFATHTNPRRPWKGKGVDITTPYRSEKRKGVARREKTLQRGAGEYDRQ
jgi:hypothetical protein